VSIDVFYHQARLRIIDLAAGLPADAFLVDVPACPGWRVHDVIGHLFGIVEDSLAGRMKKVPPDETQTAEQVARNRSTPIDEMLERWTAGAAQFEQVIAAFDVWQAAADVLSHEHDIRGALGLPGARDAEGVHEMAARLLRYRPPVPYIVEVEDAEFRCGERESGEVGGGGESGVAGAGRSGDELVLRSSYWEVLRWRLGRRSRAQLATMNWSRDPAPVLDHLFEFGPARADIAE
jgi:uncharacterized protein (TIGR03083 family)